MSTFHKKYDVFISFRGADTHETFTSHLYYALKKQNIETYIYTKFNIGDDIDVWPALVKAITDSRVSLVVFSENYATSKWCLDELLKILECRKNHRQVVIPVFYKIDPSNVRHQKESYGKAFAQYERESRGSRPLMKKVFDWRAGLTDAANISGWDSSTFSDDAVGIENIVRDVWQKLNLMYPKNLKGIHVDENCKQVESLLEYHSRIGIWGMGGMGKTTIARYMFVKNFTQYDSVCFMEKVNEESERLGITNVRIRMFSELLKREITTSDIVGGDTFIKRWLEGRKVFIVLDNVGNAAQLEYLCAELDELEPNSRLIITTRDRNILRERVDEIHEVTEWSVKESLNFFIFEAFKQRHPKKGYAGLSERAVAYAGGVPLALKVLASHCGTRSAEFWKFELDYLKNKQKSLDGIQDLLKVSYNGLTEREKDIFLDIAFFFEGEDKDFTTKILDACDFGATTGIQILEDKALVTISSNRIQMHDLLQKMAFNIVRNDQGKRSRLRDVGEVRDVLKYKKGADVVEGITFDLSQKSNLYVKADTFNMMIDLRFLQFYVPLGKGRLATLNHSDQGIIQFSDKLRYLEWNGYPLKCLPHPFCAELLVEIRLPHSNVEYLWHGMQELVNLEKIDLSECKRLTNLPDLSEASKLKSLYLSGCESLCEIQPSIFSKDTLVTLLLDRCTKLKSLMSEKHLRSLQKINVDGCSRLKEFSLSSDSIESLDLSNTGVEILHSSINGMSKLVLLNLESLKLTNLPTELSCLGLLTELQLSNCDIVTKSNLEGIFDGLGSLKTLYLKNCGNLLELPTNISSLSSLYELRLDGSSVETLPSSIKLLSELEILCIDSCKKLHSLPELPRETKEFRAEDCISLVTVSSLKSFSEQMKGKQKYISFKNGMIMNSNQPSFDLVVEDVILTMKSAAFHNILVRKYSYNSAVVCLPGSTIPRQFKYKTTDSSIITIGFPDISYSYGFILSVVISLSNGMKNEHRSGAKIQCKCYRKADHDHGVGIVSEWCSEPVTNLNMDHVFMWYDPYHFDSIFDDYENRNVSFEFFLKTDISEHADFFSIKECGICPIFESDLPELLGKINLNTKVKSDLCDAVKSMTPVYE